MEDENAFSKDREVVTITVDELEKIFTQPSWVHQDGYLKIQRANGQFVEFQITIVAAMPTTNRSSIHHQLLHGYSQVYKPRVRGMSIGHRGCGVNTVISSYTEIGTNNVDSKPDRGREYHSQLQ